MIIMGIDPDSGANGVAIYEGGKLTELHNWNTIEFYDYALWISNAQIYCEIHIEDVNGISSNAFNVKSRDTISVKLKKAEHVGKCKQAQIEVERIAEHFGIKVAKHKVSKMWKDANGKKQFEQVTGWTSRSNADTRSAAYFGFLGLK